MNKFQTALAVAGLALASSGANAALVNVTGNTVVFSFDDASLATSNFGYFVYDTQIDASNFTIASDTLTFSPTTFIASRYTDLGTVSGTGPTVSATTPLIKVTAKSGNLLTELALFEQGDYYRIEETPNNTRVSVTGQFFVDSAPQPLSLVSPLTDTMTADDYFNGEELNTSEWYVENYAYLGWTESATFKVENILKASIRANNGYNEAFIEKKELSITAWTTPVPVPGAFWLFGSALTGVLVSRRRLAA